MPALPYIKKETRSPFYRRTEISFAPAESSTIYGQRGQPTSPRAPSRSRSFAGETRWTESPLRAAQQFLALLGDLLNTNAVEIDPETGAVRVMVRGGYDVYGPGLKTDGVERHVQWVVVPQTGDVILFPTIGSRMPTILPAGSDAARKWCAFAARHEEVGRLRAARVSAHDQRYAQAEERYLRGLRTGRSNALTANNAPRNRKSA